MFRLLVRTAYRGTPIQGVTVTVLEFETLDRANIAYDNLVDKELKDKLKETFITETVTKLY